MERLQARRYWDSLLDGYSRARVRLRMHEPITLSRCSTIPILFLLIQSLVICILEAAGVPLGTAGGVVQFVVTLTLLLWIVFQLELSDAVLDRHDGLSMIHSEPTEEQMLQEV